MKFTKGIIEYVCETYSQLTLMDVNGNVVYKATVRTNEIDVIVAMNKNIIKK